MNNATVLQGADPFGGPFNGQLGRTAIVNELLALFPFAAIVETGTFTGSTTEYLLSQTSVAVHSVEIDPARFLAAGERLFRYRDRSILSCGDSRAFLKQLANDDQFPKDCVFFYLDAHWNDDLPLREEVALICSHWAQSIVMIDDFQVPDDAGYGYDNYGEGRKLSLNYLPSPIADAAVYFPSLRSELETGFRRGCVIFGTDDRATSHLDSVTRLRRWQTKRSSAPGVHADPPTSVEGSPEFPYIPRHRARQVANETEHVATTDRFLLVKAHVGFGDRLQALSHAIEYALKFQRILCVDWTDEIWSDGTIDFHTFFDVCGIETCSPKELYQLAGENIAPMGWINQLDRRADLRFLNRPAYQNLLAHVDDPAQVVVYGSIGYRKYYREILNLLRVKKEFRDAIVAELEKYRNFECVVHLRGTDRLNNGNYDEYIARITDKLRAATPASSLLVVSDCLPLYERLRVNFPDAVLRTPHLTEFNPIQGTHFQSAISKREYNLQLLIDFFLLIYAPQCVSDGDSIFSNMARFLHQGYHQDILGYDR